MLKRPPFNVHVVMSSGARGLIVGMCLHLHPYFTLCVF